MKKNGDGIWSRAWAPHALAAEAQLDGLHFHDLRHSFACWFVMRGGSLQALQQILGHATLTMTLRYAHLAPDHLRSEMAKTECDTHQKASRWAQDPAQDLSPRWSRFRSS